LARQEIPQAGRLAVESREQLIDSQENQGGTESLEIQAQSNQEKGEGKVEATRGGGIEEKG